MLMEEDNENMILQGCDAMTTVTIIDNDRPGVIGFKNQVVHVLPAGYATNGKVEIVLERSWGADGDVSCMLRTSLDHQKLKGQQPAKKDFDFKSVLDKEVRF